MNSHDDTDLITRLQTAIADRQAGVRAPEDLGDGARRAARRRSATRAVGVGAPVLAAAGVATVLATSGSSGSRPDASTSAPGSSATGHNTAFIVAHVRARLADPGPGDVVTHLLDYARGQLGPDGSLSALGPEVQESYDLYSPDGGVSMRTTYFDEHGGVYLAATNRLTPGSGGGEDDDSRTLVDYDDHTYNRQAFHRVPAPGRSTPSVSSSAAKIEKALKIGQVTQTGSATIAGTHAITLAVTQPNAGPGDRLTLFVDAQTYQPLRSVASNGDDSSLLVAEWLPATPANIAKATDDSVPAGFAETSARKMIGER